MRLGIANLLLMTMAISTTACGHPAAEPFKTMPVPPPTNLAAGTASWSEQTRVPGAYLLTLDAGTDIKVITNVYGSLDIKSIKKLGNEIFQVDLGADPGPEKMEELRNQDSRIKAVQPNFIYRSNRSVGGAQ
ncbi:MAG: hypothetical protein ACOH1I_10760 [Gallionellaceae bacterium]|jgi:hypothetical protein